MEESRFEWKANKSVPRFIVLQHWLIEVRVNEFIIDAERGLDLSPIPRVSSRF